MKYMNIKKRYQTLDLQFFAGEGEGGDNGDDAGDGDDQDEDDSDEDGEDEDEKKYSQKDVDNAVKKRLAREKRRWQREQQKKDKPDGKGKAGDDGEESEDSKARKAAENRASKAEARVACYEAGVAKDSVDDAIALARAYMENDEDLELEDAIEKVVKKYPYFKKGTADPYEADEDEKETKKKSWGQRQTGRGAKKLSGVEKRFYELNPDLKE